MLAIGLNGVLFSLLHLSALNFVPLALLGAAMAWVTWRTRSIWPAIACHIGVNTFNGLLIPKLGEYLGVSTEVVDPTGRGGLADAGDPRAADRASTMGCASPAPSRKRSRVMMEHEVFGDVRALLHSEEAPRVKWERLVALLAPYEDRPSWMEVILPYCRAHLPDDLSRPAPRHWLARALLRVAPSRCSAWSPRWGYTTSRRARRGGRTCSPTCMKRRWRWCGCG